MQTATAAEAIPETLTVPLIGAKLAGGICLAHVFVEGRPYALVVPPKAAREHAEIAWNSDSRRVAGALSYFDGLANTRAMAAAGSALATWALEQRIDGFDDWFIGSRQDLLAIRGNLSAAGAAYAKGGGEAFEDAWYWSSTQDELYDVWAWLQDFGGYGNQCYVLKSYEYRAFVLRRVPIR